MPKRSRRRGSRGSKRKTWIALALLVLIAVSGIGVYVYTTKSVPKSTTTTSSTSNTTALDSYAILDTSQGTIVLQLFPQVAPQTVANFETLANSSFYNDLVWHRIISAASDPTFSIIQTGDPNTKGAVNSTRSTWGEGEGPTLVPLETNSNYPNDIGYVGLAHTSASTSGGSEFYINLTNNTSLDGQYTVFAKVVQGMSVVTAISNLPVYTSSSSPFYDQPINANNALLISVTIQSTP
jgi:cyclophilin family peptidyl-prolyl cis-trans isomerase